MKVKDLTRNHTEAKHFYLTLSIITLAATVAIILAGLELLGTPEGYSAIVIILAAITLLIVYSAERIYALVFEIRLNTLPQEAEDKEELVKKETAKKPKKKTVK